MAVAVDGCSEDSQALELARYNLFCFVFTFVGLFCFVFLMLLV